MGVTMRKVREMNGKETFWQKERTKRNISRLLGIFLVLEVRIEVVYHEEVCETQPQVLKLQFHTWRAHSLPAASHVTPPTCTSGYAEVFCSPGAVTFNHTWMSPLLLNAIASQVL